MAKKGVVLAWQQGKAQVLDTEGRFLTVRCPKEVPVGQEINLSQAPSRLLKYAAAACLIVVLSGGIWFDNYALAYVAIDMNSSLELGVNWRDKVVTAKPLNEEATLLLTEHNVRGLSITEAVTGIVTESLKAFLAEEAPVAVISVSGKAKADAIKEIVQDTVDKELSKHNKSSQVVGVVLPSDIRAEAKEAGISPGQYALAIKATQSGNKVTAEEIKNKGLEKAMENAGVNLKEVGNQVSQGNKLGHVDKEIRDQVKGNSKDSNDNNKNPKKDK